ncbi:MAG: squalene/phytoene synthase family protein [Spirochaetota bacterium]
MLTTRGVPASALLTPSWGELEELLERVSRTFALSNRQLPAPLRREMTVAYLLFRVSDYLEDNEVMEANEKARLLLEWEQVLRGRAAEDELYRALECHQDGDPEAEPAKRFPQLLRALERLGGEEARAIRRRVCETTAGMARRQQVGVDFETESELDEYMHDVAGLVGYLITELYALFDRRLARRKPKMMPLGREYGLGLQTVNIIRGLRKDWQTGRRFIPKQYLRETEVRDRELLSPDHLDRSMPVVERLAAKAERHLRGGLSYVLLIPRGLYRIRTAAAWPLLFAARTLAVSRGNPQVVLSEAKIRRSEVKRIVRRSAMIAWSDRRLSGYYETLLRGEQG